MAEKRIYNGTADGEASTPIDLSANAEVKVNGVPFRCRKCGATAVNVASDLPPAGPHEPSSYVIWRCLNGHEQSTRIPGGAC